MNINKAWVVRQSGFVSDQHFHNWLHIDMSKFSLGLWRDATL